MDLTIYDIVLGPWMTDKAYRQNRDLKKLVLRVHPFANKPMVKEAIEKLFKVKVQDVNIINRKGKVVKRLRRSATQKSLIKKAIVTLKEGHSIDIWNHAGASALPVEGETASKKY
jgi:large subunit ribosomal protein L23